MVNPRAEPKEPDEVQYGATPIAWMTTAEIMAELYKRYGDITLIIKQRSKTTDDMLYRALWPVNSMTIGQAREQLETGVSLLRQWEAQESATKEDEDEDDDGDWWKNA